MIPANDAIKCDQFDLPVVSDDINNFIKCDQFDLPVVSDDTYNFIKCDQFDLPVVSDDTFNDAIKCDQFDLPVVSDDTSNDAIKCDQFDELIENNEIHIEKMKPFVPTHVSPDTSNIYKTSTARMLAKPIGPNSVIKEFDEIRMKVKRNVNSRIIHQ